jgi:hypothetical protein
MANDTNSPAQMIRTMRLIQIALAAGQLMFGGVALFVARPEGVSADISTNLIIVIGAMVGCIVASRKLFAVRLKAAQETQDVIEKLKVYQSAKIIQWALIEGAVLFAIVNYLIFADSVFMLIAMSGFVYFALLGVNTTEDLGQEIR